MMPPATAYLTGFWNGYTKGKTHPCFPANIEVGQRLYDTFLSEIDQQRFRDVPPTAEKPALAFKTTCMRRSETSDGWSIKFLD